MYVALDTQTLANFLAQIMNLYGYTILTKRVWLRPQTMHIHDSRL